MKLSSMSGQYTSILFNVTEFDKELEQVGCSINLFEYLTWILVDLGYPVFTPPWMAEPRLDIRAQTVKRHHTSEVQAVLWGTLTRQGYKGQELIVCTHDRAYCSISFLRSDAG